MTGADASSIGGECRGGMGIRDCICETSPQRHRRSGRGAGRLAVRGRPTDPVVGTRRPAPAEGTHDTNPEVLVAHADASDSPPASAPGPHRDRGRLDHLLRRGGVPGRLHNGPALSSAPPPDRKRSCSGASRPSQGTGEALRLARRALRSSGEGERMEADLEIGRVWDRDQRHLRVGLRFDVPGTATDDWLAAAQPLSLDLDGLDAARQKWSAAPGRRTPCNHPGGGPRHARAYSVRLRSVRSGSGG